MKTRNKSAVTGKFVSKSFAKTNPDTTIAQKAKTSFPTKNEADMLEAICNLWSGGNIPANKILKKYKLLLDDGQINWDQLQDYTIPQKQK